MKFPTKDFFSKCDEIHNGLVTFTEKNLSVKLHFLYSVNVDLSKIGPYSLYEIRRKPDFKHDPKYCSIRFTTVSSLDLLF